MTNDETMQMDWANEDESGFIWVNTRELTTLYRELRGREFDLIFSLMLRLQPGTNVIMQEDETRTETIEGIINSLPVSRRSAKSYIKMLKQNQIIRTEEVLLEDGKMVEVVLLCPAIATANPSACDAVCEMFKDYQVRTEGRKTFGEIGYFEGMTSNTDEPPEDEDEQA